jgi:ABC-type multidrug transport system ATPase subunit
LRLHTPAHNAQTDPTQELLHPSISLQNVTKTFGRFAALRNVTFDLFPHRVYALLGNNGAGKSTLLRVLAGLAKPSSGVVQVRGTLGYMAHATMLYDELTGIENLRYFATLYGVALHRCAEAINAVGLDPDLGRPVRDYSQGMKQRLSLARAVFHEPDVLLLDEPFSNVDSASAARMIALLHGLCDAGKTILVATHQAALLEEVADEFMQMDAGMIVSRRPLRPGVPA